MKDFDEDRHELVTQIVDRIVGEMGPGELRQEVWDIWYDRLIWASDQDLQDYAEEFSVGFTGD